MHLSKQKKISLFRSVYPLCSQRINDETLVQLVAIADSRNLAEIIAEGKEDLQLPAYLSELAKLELAVHDLKNNHFDLQSTTDERTINPSLQLFANSWKNLVSIINGFEHGNPEQGDELVMIWKHPFSNEVQIKKTTDEDLLVLKIVEENLSLPEIAKQGDTHVAAIEASLITALQTGMITGPPSLIARNYEESAVKGIDPQFLSARVFTLQWHITQACDLHCRHCYDRDQYASLPLHQGIAILDDFNTFCHDHHVHGQVTFTGGNPLLHPDFEIIYQEAANRGFTIGILGNPTTQEQLQRLMDIQPPSFYQVSLEGLAKHNDYIRGAGHYGRIMEFLDLLNEMHIYSMIMLTLTKDNMNQVIPLAEILKDKTDRFTFNRLSQVGEGANLSSADTADYAAFIESYIEAADTNPCMALKDNLLTIICDKNKTDLPGGCTGHGCGAAFNFLSVLEDSSVHACRKFPSPLGNLIDNSLNDIYHSSLANSYRSGPGECNSCKLRAVCRGCLAIAHSHGLDIFTQKDPYCFMDQNTICDFTAFSDVP